MAASDEPPATGVRGVRPVIEFGIAGQIDRADIPGLCERIHVLLGDATPDRLVCDVGEVLDPDAVTLDALARLQLTARRLGSGLELRHASPDLQELLAFMGLSDVVPLSGRSRLRARRQTKEREQVGGVEEEADPADPTV